jgi:hypothetical protein
VSLHPLQWALNKLADDLHDATVEIRRARLEVVSARRGAEDAREVRDAASQLHLLECRKYNAEFERRLALEKQVTELTAERDSLKQQVAELTEKLGELPDEEDEPFPDPYQWQVGDVVESDGESPRLVITRDAMGWVFFKESAFGLPQFEWEKLGWGLHRKAADLPDIQPFTPQQVAEFAAVTKPIDDSVGTDGEGQS